MKRLIDVGQNLTWLAKEVETSTGLYCDPSYLSRVMHGKRNAPKIRAAICDILSLEVK